MFKCLDTQLIEALVLAAAQGDVGAQQQLLQRYWPLIESVVRHHRRRAGAVLRAREDTSDSLQEAALRILGELTKQRWQGRSAFIGWLCELTKMQVIDQARHHNAQKRGPGAQVPLDEEQAWASMPGVETWLDGQKREQQLRVLMGELSEEQRTALYLHHLGYSHAEVGEVLECSPEAARKHVARGLARLTTMVGKSEALKKG